MHLIQIFLPVRDNNGNAFSKDYYINIREVLVKKFGGLTAYNRVPAEGLWKDEKNNAHRDDIVIFEVMADELDKLWWQKYKQQLEKIFSQDEIIMRAQSITLL